MKGLKSLLSIVVAVTFSLTVVAAPVFAENYETTVDSFTYGDYVIPAYDGDPAEEVHGGAPLFSDEELTEEAKVSYSELDGLKRCGPAFADLNQSLMPTWDRGSISSVTPSGWVQEKYDIVSGGWLYNRCHLIGWQLTGADLTSMTKAELSKNLITGTRFLNVGSGSTGMVQYENLVASYIKESDENYAAYRVTPIFDGDNLLAKGVLMEGQSIGEEGVSFCVFCYNVQPGIAIDYATGNSCLASSLETQKEIKECTFTLSSKTVPYTGKKKTPKLTIKDDEEGSVLSKDVDYEQSYSENLLPGKAKIKVVGIGAYTGTKTVIFYIVPAKGSIKSITSKKTSITAKAATRKGASGFQFAYKKKSASTWKKVSLTSSTKTIKNLKKNTSYQVKVRAYVKIDGTKHYGTWSAVKTIKTKKQ